MRVLICNFTNRKLGGAEDYLCSVIPAMDRRGFELAFAYESIIDAEQRFISLPPEAPAWCVEERGLASVLEAIRAWAPQIIYCHGPLKGAFESALIRTAPAVYFAHSYMGTCISGTKAHRFPTPRPCSQVFGPQCILQYLPRRCGGVNPITMIRLYQSESKRMERLTRYRAIVTHSGHMRDEYIKHGIPANRVFGFLDDEACQDKREFVSISQNNQQEGGKSSRAKQILFLGRMEVLKGGRILIAAAALLQRQLGVEIKVTLAGDGPDKSTWEAMAAKASATNPSLNFSFPGWLNDAQVSEALAKTDVLAVPSFWPEPFGRVGILAGEKGVPVAAFSVGGIPEWLENGVNGCLAPAEPPTASGLATAIQSCLHHPKSPQTVAAGKKLAARYSIEAHLSHLTRVFESAKAQ